MMDDAETNKQITKQYLKELPIWDLLESFNVEATVLKRDIDKNLGEIRKDFDRLNGLPPINSDGGKLKILPPKSNLDCDIVKLFNKNANNEPIILSESGDTRNNGNNGNLEPVAERVPCDPTIHQSLQLLEQKIQEGEEMFAQIVEREPWVRCKVKVVYHRPIGGSSRGTTSFKLKVVDDGKTVEVSKYSVARVQNHGDKLRVPKRVIAGPNDKELKPGIIGQEPYGFNKNRYLVLFDDGSARYCEPNHTYPICYQSISPWQDSRYIGPSNRLHEAILSQFFRQYPKRNIIQVAPGAQLEVRRNEVVVPAFVKSVDCDTMVVAYKDRSEESLYRGSARLLQRAAKISELLSNHLSFDKLYYKIPGNIKRYHEAGVMAIGESFLRFIENFDSKLSIHGNTARKSTASKTNQPARFKVRYSENFIVDDRESHPRIQDLTKNSHTFKCGPSCLDVPGVKTELYVKDLIDEFRHVSDLKVPLLLGWKRMLVRSKGKITYVYQAPCGKIHQMPHSVRRYIAATESKLDIDYFTFDREVDLNRAPVDMNAFLYKENIAQDVKTGKPLENKLISLMNQFDEGDLPMDFEYRNETFPHPMLKAKNFSFNREFKSGCDCELDCYGRSSCSCHQLNEEAHGTNAHNKGQVSINCQYQNKRLTKQVSTGIFECNEFCSCSSKCPNRVVQNGVRFRLQVRKTHQKGWGVITLDDIPPGAFISTYSAELLDDADQYGDCDMYYADLDYISVVEAQKEVYDDERVDEGLGDDNDEEYGDETKATDDEDSRGGEVGQNNKRRRRSDSDTSESEQSSSTNSSFRDFTDELLYKPKEDGRKRNGNTNGRARNGHRHGYRRIHSILNESQDYTLDARMQGNIGRFFNHSCDPNAFVQNVFIETHDLRFPVVAFFAKQAIAANEEITWNYNYKMGSIEGRMIRCNCGAPNCSGRIL